MDKLVLSDKVLSQQICSNCLNYLSVGPVFVSYDGKIFCGRCNKNVPIFDEVLKYSMYNLVAETLVFKCINHFAGCDELLFYNDAIDHEKNCRKQELACPFCAFEGNGCQLVHHFEKDHPEEVVEEGTVKIIFTDRVSKRLVLIKNSRIFCVTISISDTFIDIFNLLVTPTLNKKHEYFTLKFFKSGSNIQFVTSPIRVTHSNFPLTAPAKDSDSRKHSFILDLAEIVNCFPSGWCLCKVKLADKAAGFDGESLNCCNRLIKKLDTKLLNKVPDSSVAKEGNEEDFNMVDSILMMSVWNLRKFVNCELYKWQKCGNCKRCINDTSFYLCSKYHISCPECTNKKCPKCKVFCQWTKECVIYNLSLTCEWKGCQSDVNIFKYMEHKKNCKFREYKCPDLECGFVASLDSLKSHWHLTFLGCNNLNFFIILPQNQASYWLVSENELFYVITKFEDKSGKFLVTVNEIDVVMHGYEINLHLMDTRSAVCKTSESVKTQFDLPCGTKCTCFVKLLQDEDLKREFILKILN